jgi:hypothetical protein
VDGGRLICVLFVTTIYYSQSNGVIIMSTANTYVRARIDTETKVRLSINHPPRINSGPVPRISNTMILYNTST